MMFFSPQRPNFVARLWQAWREDVNCVLPAIRLPAVWLKCCWLIRACMRCCYIALVTVGGWPTGNWPRDLSAFARWLTNVDIHPGAK